MPPIKIGIQLASLRLPVRKAIGTAARLGANGVEFDARGEVRPQELGQTGIRELKRLLEDSGLGVSAVEFHTRRGYDVADELDRRIAATKAAMKFAAEMRARVVINQIGRVPDEAEGHGRQLLVEALGELADYGQHVGVILAAQTGSESGPALAGLLDKLPPTVGADLDPGNLIINGFSPIEAVAALGERIVHVHARDGVRDLARGAGWRWRWGAARPISRPCWRPWKNVNIADT